jgi:hypothetical protein
VTIRHDETHGSRTRHTSLNKVPAFLRTSKAIYACFATAHPVHTHRPGTPDHTVSLFMAGVLQGALHSLTYSGLGQVVATAKLIRLTSPRSRRLISL